MGNHKTMNVYELLGLSFQQLKIPSTTTFIKNHTVASLEKVFQSLEPIKRLSQKDFEVKPKNQVGVVKTFYSLASKSFAELEKEFSDKRKTRILAWSLSFSESGLKPIIESEQFPLAIDLFKKYWRNSMFLGLFDALMRKWETLPRLNQKHSSILLAFLKERISAYQGKRGNLRKIQENQNYFFNPNGASSQEKADLAMAQRTLNVWINEKFTHLFFEKIAMDYDRKNFWPGYSGKISSIKIFGTRNLYSELYRDQRLRPLLQNRFGQIDGEARLAAFVMVVKNHILIEFSEKGAAFYAYLRNGPYAPKIDPDSLHIDTLRNKIFRRQQLVNL